MRTDLSDGSSLKCCTLKSCGRDDRGQGREVNICSPDDIHNGFGLDYSEPTFYIVLPHGEDSIN